MDISIQPLLKTPENILSDLSSLSGTTHVRAEEPTLAEVGINGLVDRSGSLLLAQELEHERNGAQSSDRVGNVLALNIGRGAVAGLAHGEAITNVGRWDETERADKSGGTVRQNVTIEVGCDDHVVCGRLAEELVDHGVNNLLLNLDASVLEARLLEGSTCSRAEKTVGLRQDVALVCNGHDGILGCAVASAGPDALSPRCDLTSHAGNAVAGILGDALDGLGDLAIGSIVGLLLLDVQILGVLADNDKVDGVGECGGGNDRLDGTDVGVKVEALTEADNGAAVALGGSGRRAVVPACKQGNSKRINNRFATSIAR